MVEKEKGVRTFKIDIGLVGVSNVGKTSLIRRYCKGENVGPSKVTTIGLERETINMEIKDKPIKVTLWDPAGQEAYHNITKNYLQKLDAAVVVFDMTNEQSLIDAMRWLKNINEVHKCPTIIVGNKSDKIG